jgi:hypothetical protein
MPCAHIPGNVLHAHDIVSVRTLPQTPKNEQALQACHVHLLFRHEHHITCKSRPAAAETSHCLVNAQLYMRLLQY